MAEHFKITSIPYATEFSTDITGFGFGMPPKNKNTHNVSSIDVQVN